jgi:hypothetical protein
MLLFLLRKSGTFIWLHVGTIQHYGLVLVVFSCVQERNGVYSKENKEETNMETVKLISTGGV